MDPSKLPGRALIDTGLLTRAMGDLPPDEFTPNCKDFYEAMLANGRDLLIAAPTVAEIIRKDGKRQIPRTARIEVVAFDAVAAEILGRRMPMDVLKTIRDQLGTDLTHLKYDALIVACAARYKADCIVALDGHFPPLAATVDIDCFPPSHYLAKQLSLPVTPTVTPPAPTK